MAITFFGVATNPADNSAGTGPTIALTPPASMVAGDLVIISARYRDSAATLSMSETSGHTWYSFPQYDTANIRARLFYTVYRGSWGSDPSVTVGAGTGNMDAQMLVFRPTTAGMWWGVHAGPTTATYSAPAGAVTITGLATTMASTVTLAAWHSVDDNTWGTLTGAGWSQTSLAAQYRNNGSGSTDNSTAYAYLIRTSTGAAVDTTLTQTALGGDAGSTLIVTFSEATHPPGSQQLEDNPRLPRKQGLWEDNPSLQATTLAPSVAYLPRDPLYLYRAPNRFPQTPFLFPDLSTSTLPPTAALLPFSPKDWPNPTVPIRFAQPWYQYPNLSTSTLVPTAAVLPFSPEDWPNPVQARKPAQSIDPPHLAALLAPEAEEEASVPRAPLFTRVAGRPAAQTIAVPNLLETTLAQGVVQAPFRQSDWQNPALRRAWAQPGYDQNVSITLPQLAPFQTGWMNPAPARRVQQPDLVPNVRTTLTPSVEVLPFSAKDQPNPTLSRKVQQPDILPNLRTTLPPSAAVLPFGPEDQPNPTLARKPAQVIDAPNLSATTLAPAPGTKPFLQSDWQNPALARRVQQPDILPNLRQTLPPTAAVLPFGPEDQPNPTLARKPAQLIDAPNLSATTLAPANALLPFSPDDWTNPQIAKRARQADSFTNLLVGTLQTPPTATRVDWQNPKRLAVQPQIEVRGVFPANLPPPGPMPFSQSDWPNPRGRPPIQQPEVPLSYMALVASGPRHGRPTGRPWSGRVIEVSAQRQVDVHRFA